jgi:hypothetical protein
VDLRIELTGPLEALISMGDCPALREGDASSWFGGLGAAPHPALDAIAGAVNPRARCRPVEVVEAVGPASFAWKVVIDPGAEPQEDPEELALARVSRGASFQLEQRRPLRA